mmetsp:Transcript_39739/g.98354  ORF Transcript_39739/g.98354 Transcript_39739/m.98354 type:complete len:251 (-) Transcript_39739:251-1003(-)
MPSRMNTAGLATSNLALSSASISFSSLVITFSTTMRWFLQRGREKFASSAGGSAVSRRLSSSTSKLSMSYQFTWGRCRRYTRVCSPLLTATTCVMPLPLSPSPPRHAFRIMSSSVTCRTGTFSTCRPSSGKRRASVTRDMCSAPASSGASGSTSRFPPPTARTAAAARSLARLPWSTVYASSSLLMLTIVPLSELLLLCRRMSGVPDRSRSLSVIGRLGDELSNAASWSSVNCPEALPPAAPDNIEGPMA